MEEKVLAIVNGTKITENDFNNAILRFPKDKQNFFKSEEGRNQLLNQMISFELIYCDAKDIGADKDEKYLRDLEALKKELLIQTRMKNVIDEVVIDDSEVLKYYNDNKQQFISGESVTASHILVEDEEKAKEVAAHIQEGLGFEEAAEKYSSCPSKAEGGRLGTFTKGKMVPEFEKAAFEAEIGVVTEPVKTQFGYHLILVEDREQGVLSTFEEVKETIKNMLLAQKQENRYYEYINALSAKYSLELK